MSINSDRVGDGKVMRRYKVELKSTIFKEFPANKYNCKLVYRGLEERYKPRKKCNRVEQNPNKKNQ